MSRKKETRKDAPFGLVSFSSTALFAGTFFDFFSVLVDFLPPLFAIDFGSSDSSSDNFVAFFAAAGSRATREMEKLRVIDANEIAGVRRKDRGASEYTLLARRRVVNNEVSIVVGVILVVVVVVE